MKTATIRILAKIVLAGFIILISWNNSFAFDHPRVGKGEHGMSYGASAVFHDGNQWIFFQGKEKNGKIEYRIKYKDGWSPHYAVPDAKLTYSPTAVSYKGKLYLFHRGYSKDLIYCKIFDGSKWQDEYTITEKNIQSSPSAIVYKDKIYVFFNGKEDLYYKSFDGNNWSSAVKLNAKTLHKPGPVVYNDNLYVFHSDHGGKDKLYYVKYDGKDWTSDKYAGDIMLMGYGPSPVVYNNKVYIVHKGHSSNFLWYSVFDGNTFTHDSQIEHTSCEWSPEAFVMDGVINIVHQYGSGGLIKNVTLDDEGHYSRDRFLVGFNYEDQGFLDKKFGTFTLPATHNSAISPPEFINGNQNTTHKAPLQMEQGVRLIELDFNYSYFPFNIDLDRNVGIIHGKVYGSSAFGQRKPLSVLGEIKDWLDKNPNEVVIFKIDSPSHVKDSDLKYFFEKSGLYNRIYLDNRDWPNTTPRDVLNAGKQIIIFGATNDLKSNLYDDYIKWGGGKDNISDLNPDLGTSSKPFGGPVAYCTEGPMGFGSLDKAKSINEDKFLKPFALDSWRLSGKRPFCLTVDFSTYGELMETVWDLNHNYNSAYGSILDKEGNPLEEVEWIVEYSSDGKTVETSTYGQFNFPIRKGETIRIIPKSSNTTFIPTSISVTNDNMKDHEVFFTVSAGVSEKSNSATMDYEGKYCPYKWQLSKSLY